MSSTQANSGARTELPSEQRIAEARRQGRGPRAELAAFAAATVSVVFIFSLMGERIVGGFQVLLRAALNPAPASPARGLEFAMVELLWTLLLALCAVLVAMILSSAVAQGFVFSLRALSPSAAFPRARSVRPLIVPAALLSLGGVVLASLPELLRTTPASAFRELARFGLRAATLLSLLALVEASLSRAAFMRSLWMTREERKREERQDQGSHEARAARARARRELVRDDEP